MYGTEVAYNVPEYARANNLERSAGIRDLLTEQIFTMYRKSLYMYACMIILRCVYIHASFVATVPDNSFAGFILQRNVTPGDFVAKRDMGVLYGKDFRYVMVSTLDILSSFIRSVNRMS